MPAERTMPAERSMTIARVLIVEDDADMLQLLQRHLERDGFEVLTAAGGRAGVAALERVEVDVVLTDLVMAEVDGLELLAEVQRRRPGARVILMTAFGTLETAIEALRRGAYDYLTKPFKLAEVGLALRRAVDEQRLRRENERLRAEVERFHGLDRIMGRSAVMQQVLKQVRAVADSDASVLLLGESGTGKELVAQALHWASPRRAGPFVAINCAAVPENLLESELFGHERGAFTGADRKRIGLFASANGGTLFLDEVGELPPAMQVKLLRAIQDRAVRPVGGSETIRLDLRLVSATNRDLATMIQEGRFREDLYYRLAVIPLRLPGLRERPSDIPVIAARLLAEAATRMGKPLEGFDEGATKWIVGHAWPGNVRELENVIERAAVLARGPRITLADLGTEFSLERSGGTLRPTLAELERQYLKRVLDEVQGDRLAAAKILGISVRTLQRRLKEL